MIHLKGNILAPLGVIFISCSRLALIFFRSILSAQGKEQGFETVIKYCVDFYLFYDQSILSIWSGI